MAANNTPVWFIVGASSGFGKAIAKDALSRGQHVVAAARRVDAMSDLADMGATVLRLDVTDSAEVLAPIVQQAVDAYGYITHVINGVGYALGGANEGITDEEAIRQVTTNILGTMKMTRLVTPYLRAQKFGVIANFGSVGSWQGCPGMSHYGASKWAVSGFSEAMTIELKPFGIDVVCVEPGYFRTAFLNSGSAVWAADRMEEEYRGTPAEEYRAAAAAYDNHQPGDVSKAAPHIVDVMTKAGVSRGRDIPVRLVLGSDVYKAVVDKCNSTLALLEEWKEVSQSTDHDDK